MRRPSARCIGWLALCLGSACSQAGGLDGGQPGDGGGDDLAVTDDLAAGDLGAPTLERLSGPLGGPGSIDGVGAIARFSAPGAVVADGAGSLFIADAGNHTIRKLVLATAAVSTFAGRARTPGSSDDVGPAARFSSPQVLALGAGCLYVADVGNHTIRRVDLTTAAVTTIAGAVGQADSVDGIATGRLDSVAGLAYDGAGTLFLTEYQSTVRKVDIATGEITTLAGVHNTFGSEDGIGPLGHLKLPIGLAFSGGKLYIADSGSCTIRLLDPSTRELSTPFGVAGACGATDAMGTSAQLGAPSGIIAGAAGTLYFAEGKAGAGGETVRQINLGTSTVTTLAGTPATSGSVDGAGAAALFSGPAALGLVGGNTLYVTSADNTLRAVDLTTHAVTTVAGRAGGLRGDTDGLPDLARFTDPQALASDGAGHVYVADALAHTIRKVVLATGEVSTLAGTPHMMGSTNATGADARFFSPRSVACDGVGHLYVADIYNASIRQVDLATRAVTTLAGTPGLQGPDDGIGGAAHFSLPAAVAYDGAGALYVADRNNHTLRKIVLATREVTTVTGGAGMMGFVDGARAVARFYYPEGVVFDAPNDLYVSDQLGAALRRVNLATGEVTTVAGAAGGGVHQDGPGASARFMGLIGSATNDGAGHLFLADEFGGTVRRFTIATGVVSTAVGTPTAWGIQLGALPASLGCPAGVLALPGGDLVISDRCEDNLLLAHRP